MNVSKLVITLLVLIFGLLAIIISLPLLLNVDDLRECAAPDATSSRCAPADAIVAISGGDTEARTDEAIKLYFAGWAPKIIFSGAALDPESPSNARAMQKHAIEAGVPKRAIVLDEEAIDTTENASRTRALLQPNEKRIILVTSPYHQRRASLEFKRYYGQDVTVVNHPTQSDRLWPVNWWVTPTGWWLAISEAVKTVLVWIQR
ncbi:MAG: YdcF family protein [Candidatus Saccharimonadales bacterium]